MDKSDRNLLAQLEDNLKKKKENKIYLLIAIYYIIKMFLCIANYIYKFIV